MEPTEPSLAAIARCQDKTLLIVEHLADKLSERIEHDDAWKERTDLILMGDGNGRKGHNVRLDRLEQSGERQRWLVRVLMSGVALMVLERLVTAIG